jgi:CPW-WPC domain-containing protein
MLRFCVFVVSLAPSAHGVPSTLQSIGEMMGRSPIPMAPDMSKVDDTKEFIKGLARIPAPGPVFASSFDPVPITQDSCDRDMDEVCPEGWVRLGAVRGGSTEYCHAGSQYSGPCSDELQAFADMSSAAKQHWSRGCEAFFPCRRCMRDYREACPEGWTRLGNQRKCKPSETHYRGPCRSSVNFEGFNVAMLEAWSELCGAYWKCEDIDLGRNLLSNAPVSKEAKLNRITTGSQ